MTRLDTDSVFFRYRVADLSPILDETRTRVLPFDHMESYNGPAELHSRDEHLGVHADIRGREALGGGTLVAPRKVTNWMGRTALTLHIDGLAAAEISGLGDMSDSTAQSGQVVVPIRGLGRAPFWAARSQSELLEALRNRQPMAGASGPGGELPVWNIDQGRRLRAVLKDRYRMTDAEIDLAIESLDHFEG